MSRPSSRVCRSVRRIARCGSSSSASARRRRRRAGRAVRALGRLPREPHDHRRLRRRHARRHAERRRSRDRAGLVHAALRGQRRRRGPRLRPARPGRLAPGGPLLRRVAVGDPPGDAPAELHLHLAEHRAAEHGLLVQHLVRRRPAAPAGRRAAAARQLVELATKTSTSKDIVGSKHVPFRGHAQRQRQHDGEAHARSTWARRSAR